MPKKIFSTPTFSIFGKRKTTNDFIKKFNVPPYWINPSGKGTSEIVNINTTHIWYKRGKTTMRISIDLINKIFDYIVKHLGKNAKISSNDIVDIKNKVAPNYKGWHDCDATFIMMLLRYIFGSPIYGKKPVYIIF